MLHPHLRRGGDRSHPLSLRSTSTTAMLRTIALICGLLCFLVIYDRVVATGKYCFDAVVEGESQSFEYESMSRCRVGEIAFSKVFEIESSCEKGQ